MLEFLVELLVNGLLTLLAELFNLGLRKSLRTPADSRPLDDVLVGTAIGFILGIVSVYFFPTLALQQPVWQWLNALLSPLVAGVLIVLLRRKVKTSVTKLPQQSERAVLFQAFAVGLVFNLSRLLFGH